jgi:type I restriction enzyme, S subunit
MSDSNGLPKGWVEAMLGDVLRIIRGVSYKKEQASSTPRASYVPLLRATNIGAELDFEELVYVPTCCVDQEQMLVAGDIVVASSSGSKTVVGKASRLTADWHGSFGAFCMGLRSVPPVDSQYICYFMQTHEYRHQISDLASGSNINNLRRDHIESFPFRLAPLSEQHRIVEKSEELFSDLDAGVASLERAKANLKRYRASVLKSGVEGRLTEEWRKEHPQAEDGSFLEANWVPLEEVITLLGQGWSPKCESAPATDDAEWAVIKTSAIQSMVFLPYENKQLPDTLTPRPELAIEPGDLLITRAGPRTRAGVTCLVRRTRPRLILCDKAYRVRFNETRAFPAFAEVVLNSPYFLDRLDELKTGISDSGVNLTQKKFVELAIPLPPLAEQEQIVALVEERFSQIDSAEKTIDAELIRSKRLRQSILKRAFDGKLVPQDPKDEPASVLLERIKRCREQEQPKKKAKKATKGRVDTAHGQKRGR